MMYVELHAATHFSFLRGVSSAEELFAAAALLGYEALGIADRNGAGGWVRAFGGGEEPGAGPAPGCRLVLREGGPPLFGREARPGGSRFPRLLTLGNRRADPKKGEK